MAAPSNRSRATRALCLAGIVGAAFVLQCWGIGLDLPYAPNVDEPYFVEPAVRIAASGNLDPGWFGHPASTLIYPLAATYRLRHALADPPGVSLREAFAANPASYYSCARWLSVAFATLAVVLIYAFVRRTFDAATGLVAAALLAVNPMMAELAKVGRSDGASLFFVALTLCLSWRAFDHPTRANRALAGAGVGLAIATKYYLALFALPLGVMVIHRAWTERSTPGALRRTIFDLVSISLAMVAAFALVTPYFFLHFSRAQQNLREEAATSPMTAAASWGQALYWYATVALPATLGRIGIALLVAGAALVVKAREARRLLVLFALLSFLLAICVLRAEWQRWLVPVLPLCVGLSAHALVTGVRALTRRMRAATVPAIAVAALLVAAPSLAVTVRENRMIAAPSTRVLARRWAFEHVPSGARIAQEIDGDGWLETGLDESPGGPFTARFGASELTVRQHLSLAEGNATLESYGCSGMHYLFVNALRVDRILADPAQAPLVPFYRRLFAVGQLRAELPRSPERAGPTIRIYELPALPCP